uniref:Nuclear transcription factor Y subunit n=1 Tax=Strigamia maritima TaxID=126957 RepID=T1JAG8_STRMM
MDVVDSDYGDWMMSSNQTPVWDQQQIKIENEFGEFEFLNIDHREEQQVILHSTDGGLTWFYEMPDDGATVDANSCYVINDAAPDISMPIAEEHCSPELAIPVVEPIPVVAQSLPKLPIRNPSRPIPAVVAQSLPKLPIPNPSRRPDDPPVYVNAKQYYRILKRREARDKLIAQGRIPLFRKKYLHESRHAHAVKRNRSQTGRFESKASKAKRLKTELAVKQAEK